MAGDVLWIFVVIVVAGGTFGIFDAIAVNDGVCEVNFMISLRSRGEY